MGKRRYRKSPPVTKRTASARTPPRTSSANPRIAKLFEGSTVLITGASGLVGKMLLQKILQSCRGVKRIFVILRPISEQTASTRLSRILESCVFNKIRLRTNNSFGRIVPINGNIVEENCGMNSRDLEQIVNNVNLVFHCAALLRYDADKETATCVNYFGTRNMMQLCRRMKNLKAVVHLSTAYSFCNLPFVGENTISPPEDSLDEMCSLLDERNFGQFDIRSEAGIAERPAVIHYSEALAEHYIRRNRNRLPFAIVRPSIITGALGEPFPGWIEGQRCMNSILIAYGNGLLRSIYALSDVYADWIPVDIVANTLIAAAHYVALEKPNDVFVVNCTSSQANPLTWGELSEICYPCILKYPNITIYRYPGRTFKSNYYAHMINVALDHWANAAVTDVLEGGHRIIAAYRGMQSLLNHFGFFMTKKVEFRSTNMMTLQEFLNPADSQEFCIDVDSIDWPTYIENYIHGLRLYVTQEPDDTLEYAKVRLRRQRVQYWLSRIALVGIPAYLIKIIYSYFQAEETEAPVPS